jgi:hypothetical protein
MAAVWFDASSVSDSATCRELIGNYFDFGYAGLWTWNSTRVMKRAHRLMTRGVASRLAVAAPVNDVLGRHRLWCLLVHAD